MSQTITSPSLALLLADLKMRHRLSWRKGLFGPGLLKLALVRAFMMLRPDIQWKNPPMFVVEIAAILQILHTVAKALGYPSEASFVSLIAWDVWLLFTVLVVNFVSALNEARDMTQADALRKTRQEQ